MITLVHDHSWPELANIINQFNRIFDHTDSVFVVITQLNQF